MQNDSRPVDLLSDSKGIYGIGIVDDDIRRKEGDWSKHLILRPDVIRDSAIFPNQCRKTVLQTGRLG